MKVENHLHNKIFLVEDDKSICEMVSDYLFSEGFMADIFHTGEAAIKAFGSDCQDGINCPGINCPDIKCPGIKCQYALALIDLMLPDMSGMEIIKSIRKISTLPIIIITAKDSDADKAMGLNLGADDYVVKPFSLIELTARMKANIRRATRYSSQTEDIIQVKNLEINVAKHTVNVSGKNLDLTPTEFEILCLLASNPGQAFSKERLYGLIWKEPYFGNENVLNTHINRLRAKLKAVSESDGAYIKTLWGIGYKMEGE